MSCLAIVSSFFIKDWQISANEKQSVAVLLGIGNGRITQYKTRLGSFSHEDEIGDKAETSQL